MAKMKKAPKLIGILILIVVAIFLGNRYIVDNPNLIPQDEKLTTKEVHNPAGKDNLPEPIDIGVVTWGGYAGGQWMNGGFTASTESRFYQDYGILVNFHVLDDFAISRKAWVTGEVDLLWMTVDAFGTEVNGIANFNPEFLFQADWSYGGDVAVAVRDITNVKKMRRRTVAVAFGTPSHSFLLWMLKSNGMTVNDVTIIEVASAIDAASAFKSGEVDIAIVWSPDDQDCIDAIRGSHRLSSTKDAPFIIADGFYAKRNYVEANFNDLVKLVEGWMVGNATINTNASAKAEAAQILSEGYGLPKDFFELAIDNVRLATFEDNRNFFGLNRNYTGVTGEQLYLKTAELYRQIGMIDGSIPAFRQVTNTKILQRIHLTGSMHKAWNRGGFAMSQSDLANAREFSSKQVSVVFASGSTELDFNAMSVIDREADEMKLFADLGISIEGNTDNTGSYQANQIVSKGRAKAVANYLIEEHGIDRKRIRIVGNGWDDPVADNNTKDGRAQNRRTDFKLLKK